MCQSGELPSEQRIALIVGMGEWTKSESDSDSKTAEVANGPSAEVHCHSLAPENVGSSKIFSPTKPNKAATAAIRPYTIILATASTY